MGAAIAIAQFPRPQTPAPSWTNVPGELVAIPQWVMWGYTWKPKEGKWTKPPLQTDGRPASSTDPTTWGSFDQCQAAFYEAERGVFDGIGFVLVQGLVGVDFDHCLDRTRQITNPAVAAYVKALHSYTELSPSGTGLHVMAWGSLPIEPSPSGYKGRRRGPIELYESGRYLTVTGRTWP